jgi:hypothetical protein
MDVRSGALSATFDDNGCFLREISVAGEEIFRGIGFVARDAHWGTPGLAGEPQFRRTDDGLSLQSRGRLQIASGDLDWSISWLISPGRVEAKAEWSSASGFDTNRTGFVILHSLGASRGQSVEVTHPDGAREQATFPALVSPNQPFFDIAAMEYTTSRGSHVRLTFSGEVFEIEDQRNWTDASYKTYCRPLRLPYPYRIEPGERGEQIVRLEVLAHGPSRATERSTPRIGQQLPLPFLGTSIPPGPLGAEAASAVRELQLNFTAIELDLEAPDSWMDFDRKWTAGGERVRIDVRPSQEDVVLDALRQLSSKSGASALSGVTVWGADDALISQARALLPGIRIGAGSAAFFADLNRMRPLPTLADYLSWPSNPTVHGSTDDTIGETTEASEDLLATIVARAPDRELQVGPFTLGMRFNPVATTPEGRSGAPSDPRQKETLAAAWAVGSLSGLLSISVTALTFFEPSGPKGLLSEGGRITPAGAVLARLARLAGSPATSVRWAHAPRARGLLIESGPSVHLCIAYARGQADSLPLPQGPWRLEELTHSGFTTSEADLSGELAVSAFSVHWLTRLSLPSP